MLAFTVNYMTGSGHGPFTEVNLAAPARLAVTQGFIAVIVLVAMLIAQEAAGRVAAVKQQKPNGVNVTGCRYWRNWRSCCRRR